MEITIQTLTPQAFQPYGAMLGKPMPSKNSRPVFSNPATDFWQEHLFEVGEAGQPEILWVNYRHTAPEIDTLEVHLSTQQAIVPLTGEIIHIVAASNPDGEPDLSTLTAFSIMPGTGVCMDVGCWHTTRVRKKEARCLMLTRQSTTADLIQHLETNQPATESRLVTLAETALLNF